MVRRIGNHVCTYIRRPVITLLIAQKVTIQPFRDEVTRIAKHYVSESSPRQLHLTQQDRENCLHAVSHTTHPSALLPAFIVVEASLKGRSHLAFIRWSLSNANTHRLLLLSLLGALITILGLALDTLLVLSSLNHFLRLINVIFWWPGITVLVASSKYRLCLLLHFRNLRHIRPWELACDEPDEPSVVTFSDPFRKHARKITSTSTTSTLSSRGPDPLRKPSLQTFGPVNEPGSESWTRLYAAKSIYAKVFGETVAVQNQSLQGMQDRAVFLCIVWGGLVASTLAVASLFVPRGNMFF